MLERNNSALSCDPYAVSNADAPVAEQDRKVVERNIVADLDASALGINHDAVAHRDTVANRYCSSPPPEARPIKHFGFRSDREAPAAENRVEFDEFAKVHCLYRHELRIDRERLVEPPWGVRDIRPVLEPRGVVDVTPFTG